MSSITGPSFSLASHAANTSRIKPAPPPPPAMDATDASNAPAGNAGGDLRTAVALGASGAVSPAGASAEPTVGLGDQGLLSQVAQFAAVVNGAFNVNGRSITVDTSSDTLGLIIARINAAGAGVTAWYDSASDTLTFTPVPPEAPVQLDGDTSGFLAVVRVAIDASQARRVGAASNGIDGSLPLTSFAAFAASAESAAASVPKPDSQLLDAVKASFLSAES